MSGKRGEENKNRGEKRSSVYMPHSLYVNNVMYSVHFCNVRAVQEEKERPNCAELSFLSIRFPSLESKKGRGGECVLFSSSRGNDLVRIAAAEARHAPE